MTVTRADVERAKREWTQAVAWVHDLEAALAAAERENERAFHGDEQWEARQGVFDAIDELERAKDAEREAWREFQRLKEQHEASKP